MRTLIHPGPIAGVLVRVWKVEGGVTRPWDFRRGGRSATVIPDGTTPGGHNRLHGDGVLVVGDAASLCDPFLAEGIRPALLSGTLAAQGLVRWLGGEPTALAAYSQQLRQQWGDSMAWGKRIAQVFYLVPKIGYQLGVKRPTAPQRIAQILSGEMGYGDIAQRVIRRLLFQGS